MLLSYTLTGIQAKQWGKTFFFLEIRRQEEKCDLREINLKYSCGSLVASIFLDAINTTTTIKNI